MTDYCGCCTPQTNNNQYLDEVGLIYLLELLKRAVVSEVSKDDEHPVESGAVYKELNKLQKNLEKELQDALAKMTLDTKIKLDAFLDALKKLGVTNLNSLVIVEELPEFEEASEDVTYLLKEDDGYTMFVLRKGEWVNLGKYGYGGFEGNIELIEEEDIDEIIFG